MNFLAHLYLAGKEEDLIIGNFIADSVKGKKYLDYSEGISQGILMHREIDFFSDNNPIYLKSVHRLQPKYGKYSGIITDMFFDYLLANNWQQFSDINLEKFCKNSYSTLSKNKKKMPEESQMILHHMMNNDWLSSYNYSVGIRLSLEGMSKRMKYYFPMDKAVDELENNPELYNRDFLEFFPLLIKHVEHFKTK